MTISFPATSPRIWKPLVARQEAPGWRGRARAWFTQQVRRSELLKVVVFCPYFQRPVAASRNLSIDRLVACDEAEGCRDDAASTTTAAARSTDPARPFPHGCPVYPSLAK
jgi:hypothetical protein